MRCSSSAAGSGSLIRGRLSDQDVHLVGVELHEERVDVLLGDRLLDEPSAFRLRISRSSMEDTPERFLADNIFVELLEFIESTSSPGLPDPGGGEVLIQYA